MERLKGFLDKSLKEWKAEDALAAGRVFSLWPSIVGEAIAQRALPRFLRSGVLFVEVSSSAWANELSLMKPRFLQALDSKIGRGVIKDIRWQVAPTWQDRPAHEAESAQSTRPSLALPRLEEEEEAAIANEVSSQVPDPELAQSVGGLLTVIARRRAAKKRAGYRPCVACGALIAPQGSEITCPVCRLTGPPVPGKP